MRECRPGTCLARLSWLASDVARMSLTRVDLPEPDTPVTAQSTPPGNTTSTFLRLFSRAPRTWSLFSVLASRRFSGMAMDRLPAR